MVVGLGAWRGLIYENIKRHMKQISGKASVSLD
jgi:hypothetical protein